jgi:hypothetical protein
MLKPESQCAVDGIDFIYSEQNRYLSCNVCFTKNVVREEADARSRIASAKVSNPESGVYLDVWFQYDDSLLEVIEINGKAFILLLCRGDS